MSYLSEVIFIESLIKRSIQLQRRLKECRMSESQEGIEVFYYKGAIYDREKFVLLTMKDAQDVKYSNLKRAIIDSKKELEWDLKKGGKCAELIAAELSAYLRLLPEKKKPWFYVDDI